jgi:hypothetical protein
LVVAVDHLGHQTVKEQLVDLVADQRALTHRIILEELVHPVKEIMAALGLVN